MELWVRSTARTNLLKVRFLTIMEGKKFYKRDEWEFKGYTICNCTEQGNYELLGTYKSKERALQILDEIQNILIIKNSFNLSEETINKCFENNTEEEIQKIIKTLAVYEMPEE
jgi:hypothetical protein